MPAMKTPGVYIVEKNAFPNSIVEVATAVPAFVGYTEFATDNGKPLTKKAFPISSLAEFERYFGGPPPAAFKIAEAEANKPDDFAVVKGATRTRYAITLETTQFRLYYAMKHFFQNYGSKCWIVSVGAYGDDGKGVIDADALKGGIAALEMEQEPTLLVIPDAVELSDSDCNGVQQAMLAHCGQVMKNRFAILDVRNAKGGQGARATDDENVAFFRGNLGVNDLMFAAAYYPYVHTRIITENNLSYRNFIATELNTALADDIIPAFATMLTGEAPKPVATLTDEAKTAVGDDEEKQKLWVATREGQINAALVQGSALYNTILQQSARKLNLMPPSAAMAGLYTMVDNSRGVWKAPANISINNAIEPAIPISHAEQESLNVDPQGKSINAIRSFIGEGTLVWGARTLDGNSLDWRYINVRRTMIMLEESCKLAAKAMVFEPNVAGTWLTIKSMIQNFLTGIWRRGGLMGAIPDDAFQVYCGLGETMTPEDVLEGILRVTVLVAMVRPAEFIEITFQQLMPKS